MSLAELFYAKQSSRRSWWRWARTPRVSSPQSALRRQPFLFESLEPRLLMSTTPVPDPLALTTEAAIEPAASVIPILTEVLALTGNAAPNSNGVGTSGTYSGFGIPEINDLGQVAFTSTVAGSTSTGGVFRSNSTGNLVALTRVGDAAPNSNGSGTSGTIAGFVTDSLALNDAGQAAFRATIVGSISTEGLFRTSGVGTLAALARVGDQAPNSSGIGASGTLIGVGTPVLNDAGQVAFLAILSDFNPGLFRSGGPGALIAIARIGDPAPNFEFVNGALQSFGLYTINQSGQVAFFSDVANSLNGDSPQGLFRGSGPGSLTEVSRVSMNFLINNQVIKVTGYVDGPALDNQGNGVYVANLRGPFSINQGILKNDIPVVLERDSAPLGGGGTLGDLYELHQPVVNSAGQVDFVATARSLNGFVDRGIFRRGPNGVVEALVRTPDLVPDGNGHFNTLATPFLTEGGSTAFFATLNSTAGGTADDTGIYLSDGLQMLQVAREGQPLAGSIVTGLQLLTGPDTGGRSPVNDAGQVAYLANLADGRSAIVRVTIPDIHYRSAVNGSWDTGANWTASAFPSSTQHVIIDPLAGVAVTGPAAATTVADVTIGAQQSGIADLQLNAGGNVTVTNALTIQSLGSLTQVLGSLTASTVQNAGTLAQTGGTMSITSLANTGTTSVGGRTTIATSLTNNGLLSVGTGGVLVDAAGFVNRLNVALNGGTLQANVINDFGATFSGKGTITGTLTNNGALTAAGGGIASNGLTTNVGQLMLPSGSFMDVAGGISNLGLVGLSGGALRGTGAFTNQVTGIVEGTGSVTTPFSNLGTILVRDNDQLVLVPAFSSSGRIALAGTSAFLSGGTITHSGTMTGFGTVLNTVANSGTIRAEGGTLVLSAAGDTNVAGGRIEAIPGATVLYTQGLSTNAGTLALTGGRFDNNLRALTNVGQILGRGTLNTGGLTNTGLITFADGPTDVFGTITNNAALNITNSTSTFFNAVTNNAGATIKNTAGVARFLGGFTNNGAFISDPADNVFTDLAVTDTGYLVGGTGDRFLVSGNFSNASTQNTLWDTRNAELIFQQGVGPHTFQLDGADQGGGVAGLANNFAWGTVRLTAGQSMTLQDGNATPGGALFVKNFVLEGGLSQVNSIQGNGLNIYYDSLAPANSYLNGQIYHLGNGGVLAPIRALDVNGDGLATPQDAIVVLRYLSLVRGPALTAGVITGGPRTDPGAIADYLSQTLGNMLDVNQDGQATPQDAIVILRHLSLVSGPALTAGVVTGGTQTDPTAIKTYLNRYTPGAQSQSSALEVTSPSSSGSVTFSAQPIVLSTQQTVVSTQEPALDTASAIAATQLSTVSGSTKPWVANFLGTQEEEEWAVTV